MVDSQTGQQRRAREAIDDSRRSRGGKHGRFRGVDIVDSQCLDELFDYRQPRRLPLDVLAYLLQESASLVALQVLGNLRLVQFVNALDTRQAVGNHASPASATACRRLAFVFVPLVFVRGIEVKLIVLV